MSASIDVSPKASSDSSKVIPFPRNARTHAVTSPRLAVVVAYANPEGNSETQVDIQSEASLVEALRKQILSLAEHYARDVANLTEREEALMADVDTLEADNKDAWQQLSHMHVRATDAEADAATAQEQTEAAIAEANELVQQVRELSLVVGALRADLVAAQQRARLFQEAAHCGIFERGAKKKLLAAAESLPG